MTKPPLHFSHANSFPAGAYRKMLRALEAHYDVGYLEILGHDPAYPVTDCWPNLVKQSIAYIEQRYREPVVAVGHSLGGFLSFLSAIERPELFRAVVLLDSPIFSWQVSTMLWLGKRLGFIERLTPGSGTLTRRHEWPDTEAALQHFSGRGTFAAFDHECLRDYVESGTVPGGAGVQLRFRREIEYQIYCGLPHIFPRYRGRLSVPTGFIGGSQSAYVRKSDLRQMQKHFGIRLAQVEGGHMFPLEKPEAAAAAIMEMVEALLSTAPEVVRA